MCVNELCHTHEGLLSQYHVKMILMKHIKSPTYEWSMSRMNASSTEGGGCVRRPSRRGRSRGGGRKGGRGIKRCTALVHLAQWQLVIAALSIRVGWHGRICTQGYQTKCEFSNEILCVCHFVRDRIIKQNVGYKDRAVVSGVVGAPLIPMQLVHWCQVVIGAKTRGGCTPLPPTYCPFCLSSQHPYSTHSYRRWCRCDALPRTWQGTAPSARC